MSLPNYLAKIKSSGVYRYVFDKSQVPAQEAGTLRLVVGYSEKGPFNTPLYVENKKDFISNFGNINKRLEKKGIFFHRMALQALNAGPILALNIKPFGSSDETQMPTVKTAGIVPWMAKSVDGEMADIRSDKQVKDIYDTNRFWKLDADLLPEKLGADEDSGTASDPNFTYIKIATTDTIDNSCSFFIRPYVPASYDISLRDWYTTQPDMEAPSYLLGTYEQDGVEKPYLDLNLKNFFAEVYVFKGEFTKALCGNGGTLAKYFNVSEDGMDIELKPFVSNAFKKRVDTLEALADDPNSGFIGVYQGCLLPEFTDANGNYISLDILFNSDHVNHKMLMKLDDRFIEDMIESIKFYSLGSTIYNTDWQTTIDSALDGAENDLNNKNLQKCQLHYAYQPTYMQGYTYGLLNQTMTSEEWQKRIFTVLNSDESEGMQEALTNNVDCEYHYIVDTFESFVEKDCKSVLSAIARKKDNAFAILNFPAIKKFMDYKYNNFAKFYDSRTGRFDMKKLTDKDNLLNHFCLPKDADGASWAAYYTPVILSDGTIKTTVPSAALVSNLFMEKWSSRQPYYIVAGPNHGRLSENGLVGPDYNYSRADLDVLEPLGANVIIYVPRKGVFINSNQTAKQVPVSALSKVHVRELVIYLQNEIEKMLQNYQWELNTSTLRDTIKTKADTILETVAANGGVYAYLNVCDESNNTPEVIDNEMIILDTSIEPARGAGKMVQRLTIHRTGGISSLK